MKCIICGNVEFKLLHKGTRDKEDIDVYSCLHCGGGQLSTFSHIYDGFYENSEMWEDVNVPAFEEKMAWKDDMRRVQLVLGDMGGFNKWICDFGCGYGGFLDLITPYVPKAVGVELEQKARQKMQSRGLRVEESLTMYDEKFDIITSFQVIEHLISPHEYINQISAKLNRNGKIMDLPSLRTMTQAGGKLSPQLHKEFAEYALEKGIHFIVMYGQTEATARMSYLPHDKALIKYGSMGIAIPGGKFSLIDAEENIISESNIVGELVYEGENVTLGYAECREDLQKGDERNGVLFTGDMAKKDDDGYYYIVGRKKRFLKIYGNRVNLDEVERMLATAYPDMEFACIGVDDHMQIFMTRCGEQQCDVIRDFVAERTGLNRIAFEVRKIDEIPKNDSGKKLYSELADK